MKGNNFMVKKIIWILIIVASIILGWFIFNWEVVIID